MTAAHPLRRGSPGLDSGPLGWPLFHCRTAPGQHPLPPCRILVDTNSEASEASEGINEAQTHLDQNVLARYATVAPASILGLAGGLFSAAARPPVSARSPLWRKRGTRK